MNDDQVKAALRRAVVAGLLTGWYQHVPLFGKEWVLTPAGGPSVCYDAAAVRDYCELVSTVTA